MIDEPLHLCMHVCVHQCARQWRLGGSSQLVVTQQSQRVSNFPHRAVETLQTAASNS